MLSQSPGLPVLGRVCTLCVSNACRAVCGVSGGSSKAILSSHFAKAGNIGELNAKDSSQETVVSLIGMWIGGLIVSNVHGTIETWCCLIPLLALHLWANWKAVKSVRLTSLNNNRALILFRSLLQGQTKDMNQVGTEESILGWGHLLRSQRDVFRAGVSVSEFLHRLPGGDKDETRKYKTFVQLVEVFGEEDYLLWCDLQMQSGIVLLKESAIGETQAKAICHFLRATTLATGLAGSPTSLRQQKRIEKVELVRQSASESELKLDEGDQNFQLISQTLQRNRREWQSLRDQLALAGWDLSLTNLAGGRCNLIRTNDVPFQEKKDR